MDFAWNEEQQAFRREVIRFAQEELNDNLIERDLHEEFSWDAWRKCAKFGIQGLPVPQEYGGGDADILTTVCGLEALGYGCRDNGLIFSINAHMWTSEIPILHFGTEAQKKKYLPKLVSGEWIGLHAMTEPMSGSDAFSMLSRAERKGDRYVINGSKTFITNAQNAEVIIIFANLDPEKGAGGITAFLVDKDTPGFSISKKLHKMGLRTSPMAELSLVDVEVPVENLLGREGGGQVIFTVSMEWERICIMASHLGAMQRMLETSVKYAKERRQFGQPIGNFAPISTKIADMDIRLETARLVLYKAAWLKSQGRHALREGSIAKAYVADACIQSCLDAIQIHGGYGYMTEYQIERELRDAISGKIYSGTTEIQKKIIAGFHGVSDVAPAAPPAIPARREQG
ncbi:MAG: acyl-CoA dehydrogenase family protein [Acidobacteriia bacterium]|nr:acyl-CoA dehydrogenase family protein [Terriglobia bacterium]